MGQASSARGLRRSQCTAVNLAAATLALAASTAAVAADYKVVDGVIQFPNTVVINAPRETAAATAPQGGMKAYKDSASSELRGPTTEEMQAASRASTSAAPLSRRAAGTDAAASSDAAGYASAGGGVGVTLDESSMQYSVVVRRADGSLDEICVTGADEANAVNKNHAAASSVARKGNSNVR